MESYIRKCPMCGVGHIVAERPHGNCAVYLCGTPGCGQRYWEQQNEETRYYRVGIEPADLPSVSEKSLG